VHQLLNKSSDITEIFRRHVATYDVLAHYC